MARTVAVICLHSSTEQAKVACVSKSEAINYAELKHLG